MNEAHQARIVELVECEDAGKEEVVAVGLDGYVHGINGMGNGDGCEE